MNVRNNSHVACKFLRVAILLFSGLMATSVANAKEIFPQRNCLPQDRHRTGQLSGEFSDQTRNSLVANMLPLLVAELLDSDEVRISGTVGSDMTPQSESEPLFQCTVSAESAAGSPEPPAAEACASQRGAQDQKRVEATANRAIVSLELNGLVAGDSVVYFRADDVLVSVQELERAGLSGFAGKREEIGGELLVSLQSLKPSITFQLDTAEATLRLTAEPRYFGTKVVNFTGVKPPADLRYSSDTSLFANYSFGLNDFKRFRAFAEAGLSMSGRYLLYSSAFRNSNGRLARGLTNLTVDDRQGLRRWVFGDAVTATPDPLGGTATIGGFNLSKNFSLDPYLIKFPQQSVSGTLMTPSTVEVYRNGTLILREELPPGLFDLRNIPFSAGEGITSVVIRNALGQVQELRNSYYLNTEVLKRGLSQYQYAFGLARRAFGAGSFNYGNLAYQGYYLHGVTDWLSAGARFEGSGLGDLLNGGLILATTTPVGAFRGSAAASRESNSSGYAANLAYSYVQRDLSFGLRAGLMSRHYSNLSLSPSTDRALYEVSFFGGLGLGPWVSFVPEYSWAKFRDAGSSQSAGLTFDFELPFDAALLVAARYNRQQATRPSLTISASLVFSLGGGRTVSASYDRDLRSESKIGHRSVLQFQKSLPLGPGYGYLLQAEHGQGRAGGVVNLRYHSGFGSYEAMFQRLNGRKTSDFTVAGGVVVVGGRTFATRPVSDAFALLRTPGLSGVEATLYNQPMGVTDKDGGLLIPNLMPYFGNEIGINAEKIPIDYQVDSTKEFVAPPFRGGAVVDFPIRRIQAVVGNLKVITADQISVPAFGELTVTASGKTFISPIGSNGEFYLDSPSAGRHPAIIEFDKGECRFEMDLPKTEATSVKLGTLRCVMAPPPSSLDQGPAP